MSTRRGRIGAGAGLLLAIFSDLWRRAWWAYRTGNLHANQPQTTIVAPRPTVPQPYIPTVTTAWRPAAARALPVGDIVNGAGDPDDRPAVVWIDVAERPDIADLPRVFRNERTERAGLPVMATQWLVDRETLRIILIVTYLEPVACTWALSFDMPRCMVLLRHITRTGELFVAWERLSPAEDLLDDVVLLHRSRPSDGVLLPISRPAQLYTILTSWQGSHDLA